MVRRILLGVVSVCLIGMALLHWRSQRAFNAHLFEADPDSIPADLAHKAIDLGKPAFAEHCAACHGSQARGDRTRGVPDLTDADWLYGTGRVLEIERVILYGIRSGNSKGWKLASMPAFATQNPYSQYKMPWLTPREIDDVTEYILSFQGHSSDAAAIERGGQLFRNGERGVCWDCHDDRAQGNSAIGAPDLTDNIWLYGDGSRDSIHQSIAYGRAGVCPAWITRLPAVTIRAIAVYVHSLSARNDRRSGTQEKS
jgi:cytochrome c oxidase cbb3-type subunit 3